MEEPKKQIIGFTTMTADMFHNGHLLFLKSARALCDILIVGVTTDERCTMRKRVPIIPYTERAAIVGALKCVDAVVEDAGQAKLDICRDLNVSRVFIGDDYRSSPEYKAIEGSVEVFYLPRTSGISTSSLISSLEDTTLNNMAVESYGISGPVLRFDLSSRKIIFKAVLLGAQESDAIDGRDVYGIATPPPRNWKVGKIVENKFPMISGINGWREIIVMERLKDLDFVPFVNSRVVNSRLPVFCTNSTDKIDIMQYERKNSTKTVFIEMKYAGETLASYIRNLQIKYPDRVEEIFNKICLAVKKHIATLEKRGVLHGDLHPNNVCYDEEKDQVYLIDFGWCLAPKMMVMSSEERGYFNQCVSNNFDWGHYVDSLESFNLMKFFDKRLM